jgi:hypothetical protein
MARKPTLAQLLDELLTRYEQSVAEAFRAAVADLAAGADLQRLIAALTNGDLNAAMDALHLDPAAYGKLRDAIEQAYGEAGQITTDSLPALKDRTGARVVIRWSARNYRAEAFLREHGANLVTRIVEDQRQAVRTRLETAMREGVNPRTAALEIVGRVNRATGKREGGIIGLSTAQEGYVANARAELTSEDPAALRRYLERARRDKRFDRSVQKAIREGTPLPQDVAMKALDRYQARLLQLRGEMIGRSEALRSLNAASHEALLQAVDSGAITAAQVRRVWRSAGDLRVRHTHQALNGDSVGLEERFRSPSGALLLYPGDPSAPASETVNCRCIVQPRIDFLANLT